MQLRRLLLRSLLGARLPKTEGTLHVPGLQGAITLRRARHGIAYVDAEHEPDPWLRLGSRAPPGAGGPAPRPPPRGCVPPPRGPARPPPPPPPRRARVRHPARPT